MSLGKASSSTLARLSIVFTNPWECRRKKGRIMTLLRLVEPSFDSQAAELNSDIPAVLNLKLIQIEPGLSAWEQYEKYKAIFRRMELAPDEYEKAIAWLAAKLGI
jgi:hypothetical protein